MNLAVVPGIRAGLGEAAGRQLDRVGQSVSVVIGISRIGEPDRHDEIVGGGPGGGGENVVVGLQT